MKERPILFSAPMVSAILEGLKSQTRRVIKQDVCFGSAGNDVPLVVDGLTPLVCPYGQPGDRLWVKETFRAFNDGDIFYRADFIQYGEDYIPVHADDKPEDWKWQPSIFMARKQSRITLEITKVRVERVQEISEADAKAEGVVLFRVDADAVNAAIFKEAERVRAKDGDTVEVELPKGTVTQHYRDGYKCLWDSINAKREGGKYAWARNPWVWVLEFRRLDDSASRG